MIVVPALFAVVFCIGSDNMLSCAGLSGSTAWAGTEADTVPIMHPDPSANPPISPPNDTAPLVDPEQPPVSPATGAGDSQPAQSSPTSDLSTSQSATAQPPMSLPTGSANGEQETRTGFVDTLHANISARILTTATWMDSFFTDESYIKEENRSFVRFRYDIFQEQQARLSLKPAFDLRLALPALERKTRLSFSAEPAENPAAADAPVRTAGERFGTPAQSSFTTALQYVFRATPEESFIIKSGLQFIKTTPAAFIAPRYRILVPYPPWYLRITQEVLWNTRTNWQTDTRFDLERPLPHDLFFRTSLDGVWAASTYNYNYSLSFSIRQSLDASHAIDYAWINSFHTRPVDELTEVAFRIAYRQNFWRSWLFYEIAPQVRFPQNRNFQDTPGILFRLEMFFGPKA